MIREPAFTEIEVAALQKLNAGTATKDEQRIALRWILSEACAIYDDGMAVEHDREVHHASGRRFVGVWINKLMTPEAFALARERIKKPTAPRRNMRPK